MEISNLLSISTIEYADYISELPEDQRLIKISEYIEWYLTRTESSFFFNEIEFQIDFTYKNIILSPNGKRYVTLGYDFAIHIHTYPERSLLLKFDPMSISPSCYWTSIRSLTLLRSIRSSRPMDASM